MTSILVSCPYFLISEVINLSFSLHIYIYIYSASNKAKVTEFPPTHLPFCLSEPTFPSSSCPTAPQNCRRWSVQQTPRGLRATRHTPPPSDCWGKVGFQEQPRSWQQLHHCGMGLASLDYLALLTSSTNLPCDLSRDICGDGNTFNHYKSPFDVYFILILLCLLKCLSSQLWNEELVIFPAVATAHWWDKPCVLLTERVLFVTQWSKVHASSQWTNILALEAPWLLS